MNNMLYDYCNGKRDNRPLSAHTGLQAPCHRETWRRRNKIKDLVDYLCLLGVKQRVFLHVNEEVDTLVPESRS